MYVIPLTTDPNQTFQSMIPIDGENRRLSIELRYNDIAKYWVMSITDANTRKMLVDSIPLLAGKYPAANLLGQFGYLGVGSATIVSVGPISECANPDDTTLGASHIIVWGDTIVQ